MEAPALPQRRPTVPRQHPCPPRSPPPSPCSPGSSSAPILLGGLGRGTRRRGIHFLARTRRRLRNGWRDARGVFLLIARRGKARFALSLSLTAVQWSARYSVISALVAFLGAPMQPVLFWLLQWVVFTLMSFIPTPGAAGGAEAAFYFIYAPFLPHRIIGLATAAGASSPSTSSSRSPPSSSSC